MMAQEHTIETSSTTLAAAAEASLSSASLSRRRRVPGRVSEYLDTSRLDMARTKRYGILMVPDFADKHPIDVGGWTQKRDAATNTTPTTRIVPYSGSGNLPLLETPRSIGTQPYTRRERNTRFGMIRAASKNEFARTLTIVQRPSTLDIDFSFPAFLGNEALPNTMGLKKVPATIADHSTVKKKKKKERETKGKKKERGKEGKREENIEEEMNEEKGNDANPHGITIDASETAVSAPSSCTNIENPEEVQPSQTDMDKAEPVATRKPTDADPNSDSNSSDAGSEEEVKPSEEDRITAARDAYPKARSGWQPSERHLAMVQRMEERKNYRRNLELHRGCQRGWLNRKKQHPNGYCNANKDIAKGIDLSVGLAAFDPSYNHTCPISIYKSRRERNSRYGFRFN